ncbi:MAG TPA: hypothetical protein VH062_35690 [Polyangiaceae bacterium]|jgi:hypothetical protein|nr:hypothetical protein [Polyangiaceae bacterium]
MIEAGVIVPAPDGGWPLPHFFGAEMLRLDAIARKAAAAELRDPDSVDMSNAGMLVTYD